MATRFTIDFEDMSEDDAAGLGLWLDAILREETEHTVQKVSYARNLPEAGAIVINGSGGGCDGVAFAQGAPTILYVGGGGGRPPAGDPL